MGIYRYLCEMGGGDKPFTARVKLSENVNVDKGDILYYITDTQRVTPERGVSNVIAGVCAKDYKAEKDELVPAYGSMEVEVIISPNALYRVPSYIISDDNGVDKNAVCTSQDILEFRRTEGCVGSKLILVEKDKNSLNRTPVGTVFTITDVAGAEGKFAFYTDKPTDSSKGDKYVFVPGFGFERFFISDNNELDMRFENDGDIVVVDADENGLTVFIKNIGVIA